MRKFLSWFLSCVIICTGIALTSCNETEGSDPSSDSKDTVEQTEEPTDTTATSDTADPNGDNGGATTPDSGNTDNGGTTTPDSGNTDNGGTTTPDSGNTDNGGATTPDSGNTDNGGATTPDSGNTDNGGTTTPDSGNTDNGDTTTPLTKTPYELHEAAILTVKNLTNGTVTLSQDSKSEYSTGGTMESSQHAVIKFNGGNIDVQQVLKSATMESTKSAILADGIGYVSDSNGKRRAAMTSESFASTHIPFGSLENAMIPLCEQDLANVALVSENGQYSFEIVMDAATYSELTGINGASFDTMTYVVVFDANGTLISVTSTAKSAIIDKDGRSINATSMLALTLSDLNSTAAITAPADLDQYIAEGSGSAGQGTIVTESAQPPKNSTDSST